MDKHGEDRRQIYMIVMVRRSVGNICIGLLMCSGNGNNETTHYIYIYTYIIYRCVVIGGEAGQGVVGSLLTLVPAGLNDSLDTRFILHLQ